METSQMICLILVSSSIILLLFFETPLSSHFLQVEQNRKKKDICYVWALESNGEPSNNPSDPCLQSTCICLSNMCLFFLPVMKLLSSWETLHLFVASTFMSSHYLKAISQCGRDTVFEPVISFKVWKNPCWFNFFFLSSIIFISYGERKYDHKFKLSSHCMKNAVELLDCS